jgi:hypothetical protein
VRAAQIAMSLHQQLQHSGVVIEHHPAERLVAERGDRDGAGIVRIVLLRLARTQQSCAGRQHRRNVDHDLAGGDELLGEEIAEPAGGLDRPHPIREQCRPAAELVGLFRTRSDTQFVEHTLGVGDHDGGV